MDWSDIVESDVPIDSKPIVIPDCIVAKQHKVIPEPCAIMATSLPSIADNMILEYMTSISSLINKEIISANMNKNEFNSESILQKITWLAHATKFLNNKLNMTVHLHKSADNILIPRSSYKFCNNTYACETNYPYNYPNIHLCNSQHYVYNTVYADIVAICSYVETHSVTDINFSELIKCSKTVAFVIKHMTDELNNALIKYADVPIVTLHANKPKVATKHHQRKKY